MSALARAIIRLSAWLVPSAARNDWREAWLAELEAVASEMPGQPGAIARHQVRFALGAPRHALCEALDEWSMTGTWGDVTYAWRRLLASPSYTLPIVLTLGLGIGANALVFTVVRSVLLSPLPFPEPDRLVNVWQTQPGNLTRTVAPANFLDWREAQSFEGLAAYGMRRRALAMDEPERILVAAVSSNFFALLGVTPSLGQLFDPFASDGEVRGLLLREDLFERRFGGDPSVLGTTVRLDDDTFVLRGIVPLASAFPEDVVAWTQARYDIPELALGAAPDLRRVRDARYFRVLGRLAPNASLAQAQAEMDAMAARLREAYPEANADTGVNVVDLHTQITGTTAPLLWMLLGTVACVLAIACANVASLLLASTLKRARELRVRSALGASRLRLARQLTIESLLLASAGAVSGLALAWAARPGVIGLLPAATPRLQAVDIDERVVLYTVAVSLVTAVLFGVGPALIASRAGGADALRAGGRATGRGGRTASLLVTAQLAIALMLVTGTGAMARALSTLRGSETGVDIERVLAADVSLPDARSRGRAAAAATVQQMVDRLAVIPGVAAAAATQTLPMTGRSFSAELRVTGRTFAVNEAPDVVWSVVTPDYFRTVGARIQRGRAFTPTDREGSQPVAMVNETLARLIWPDGDPLGARIGTGLDGDGAPLLVVGIVSDIAQEVGAPVSPAIYRPVAQPSRFGFEGMSLVVRTDGDPAALTTAVRGAIRDVHPQAPVAAIRPLSVVAGAGIARERTATFALAAFGALALTLAAVGLHGLLLRLVGDRMREIGIRIALGAAPADVRWLVLRRTAVLAGAGCVAGICGAALSARAIGGLLHGVSPADPVVLAGAATVFTAVSALASYLPTRRAARVDPLLVIRAD